MFHDLFPHKSHHIMDLSPSHERPIEQFLACNQNQRVDRFTKSKGKVSDNLHRQNKLKLNAGFSFWRKGPIIICASIWVISIVCSANVIVFSEHAENYKNFGSRIHKFKASTGVSSTTLQAKFIETTYYDTWAEKKHTFQEIGLNLLPLSNILKKVQLRHSWLTLFKIIKQFH